jgi:hypothetical protein
MNTTLEQWLDQLARIDPMDFSPRAREAACAAPQQWPADEESLALAAAFYRRQGASSRTRHHVLRWLARAETNAALARFAELVASDPPGRAEDAVMAFVPLFQRKTYDPRALFPRLLDALEHPGAAAAVLDLANYLTRQGRLSPHPAADRAGRLAALLGNLVEGLNLLQEQPPESAEGQDRIREQVNESVALVVSLCDALALVGDKVAVGKLYQALDLSHRRLRTEAAAALARLGEQAGVDVLVEMVAEPVVRPAALACLDELGLVDRVPEDRRNPVARAEGDLAAWLAEPAQFGLAPSSLELVDSRRQFWPGYVEPIDCYLFRYRYVFARQELTGVAITGPVTHAFHADLEDLPPADIHAAYAGWQAEHEEIRETPAEQLDPRAAARFARLAERLAEQGYQEARLVKVGHFFGGDFPVATVSRSGQPGVIVVDGDAIAWFPCGSTQRPLGPDEAYNIFKGRRLLRAFNESSQE